MGACPARAIATVFILKLQSSGSPRRVRSYQSALFIQLLSSADHIKQVKLTIWTCGKHPLLDYRAILQCTTVPGSVQVVPACEHSPTPLTRMQGSLCSTCRPNTAPPAPARPQPRQALTVSCNSARKAHQQGPAATPAGLLAAAAAAAVLSLAPQPAGAAALEPLAQQQVHSEMTAKCTMLPNYILSHTAYV